MKTSFQDIYLVKPKQSYRMKVNIDALIPRSDFATIGATDSANNTNFTNISILTLKTGIIMPLLKKPDFQRETSEWDKSNICELLESLFYNDLIPAIILWQSKANNYFVLDGAHRLSALIAWYLNDYGDGEISRKFHNNDIPPAQLDLAKKTREYINKKIGSYAEIEKALTHVNAKPKHIEISKKLSVGIPVQWLYGDADKAETSFFKINKQGVPLNPTERKLLKSRKKANCIAARAIIKRGKGYKYWHEFKDDVQEKITLFSEQCHDILFLPPLVDSSKEIRTLDLPIAGTLLAAQTLPLVYDLISLTNNLDIKNLKDDKTGDETLLLLQNTRKIFYRINSRNTGSLGLHPAVYFYSSLGRHQPTAVLAVTALIMEMEDLDYFRTFLKVRSSFEDFIINYKAFFNQVTKKFGSGVKGYIHLKDLLWFIIKKYEEGKDESQILKSLSTDNNFKFLNPNDVETETTSKKFSKSVKSGIFLKEHLPAKARCKLCNGHIHMDGISNDHIIRGSEGGMGNLNNGQMSHPYCNSVLKR